MKPKRRKSKRIKPKRMKPKRRKSKRMKPKRRKSKRMKKIRKSKLSGGAVSGRCTPLRFCNHNHTIYFCKDHFDKLWNPAEPRCHFWTEIHRQLKDEKSVNSRAYNDQVGSGEITQHACRCCVIGGDRFCKPCAGFRLVQICFMNSTCPGLLEFAPCRGARNGTDCVFCTSI